MTTQNKANLYQKIIKVMSSVGQLQKDGDIFDNKGKKMYAYLSEERTTGELQKAFIEHGIVLFPIKVESEVIYLESMKYDVEVKTPITKVIVTYKICDAETGEYEELQSIGYGSDSQDKGSNKAMTSSFKYVQRQTFMISTGDDSDHIGSDELDRKQLEKVKVEGIPLIGSKDEAVAAGEKRLAEQKAKAAYNKQSSDKISDAQLKLFSNKAKQSGYISDEQIAHLKADLLSKFGVSEPADIPKKDFNKALTWIQETSAPTEVAMELKKINDTEYTGNPDDDLPF